MAETCPYMASITKSFGFPNSRKRSPGYLSLLRIIIAQQLSVAAGEAIWLRFLNGVINPTPEKVIKTPASSLRNLGLSRQKIEYIHALSKALLDGSIDLAGLSSKNDSEVIKLLTQVKGIGVWSAQIYLMFSLDRRDVWPTDDLALSISVKELLNLKERPYGGNFLRVSEQWKPRRTAAAMLLWHYYHNLP